MKKRFQVKLRRTEGEWKVIDGMLTDFSEAGWCGFWRRHLANLREEFRQNPDKITRGSGRKELRSLELSEAQFQLLKKISDKMKKPIPAVLNELILSPILRKRP